MQKPRRMEEQSLGNQYYCHGCLCKINKKPSNMYDFKCNVLIEILQIKQVPLCSYCMKRAYQTEHFIQNVQENQTLLENSLKITDSNIKEVQSKYNPAVNCTIIKLNPVELSGEDDLKGFIPISKTEACEDTIGAEICEKTKVKIEIEQCLEDVPIFEEFIEDDNIHEDINAVIKKEILNEDECPLKLLKEDIISKVLKKGKARKRVKLEEPWLDDLKIKKIKISKKQCLKERMEAANNEVYLKRQWKCTDCIKGFNYKGSYDRHIMERHSVTNGDYECSICKQRYQTESKLIEHQIYHFTRYKCPKCDLVRVIRGSIKNHYTNHHCKEKNNYCCPQCPKFFNCYIYLKKHINKSHNKKRAICEYCNKTLACKDSLKNHMMRQHSDKVPAFVKPRLHVCEDCGDSFDSASRLKAHRVKHTSEKRFYCVECDKSFKTELSLKTHLNTALSHVNNIDLRFPCSHCDKRFSNKRSLNTHTNLRHLNIFPYKCDNCDKCYARLDSLRHHYKFTHEGYKRPRQFPCSMCDKIFDQRTILKSHLRTHTGERPYQCSKCPASFTQPGVLNTHVKLVHLKLTRDGRPKNGVKV